MQEPQPISAAFFHKYSRWGIAAFWIYLAFLTYCYGTSINLADGDLWHRFALCDYLTRTGHFPTGDTFSYDADYQFVPDHEWGSSLIFYPTYLLGGGTGLILLKLLLLGETLALTVRAALGRRSPTLLETFFFSLVLLALLPSFLSTLRCGAFTHVILALWVLWFQRERQGSPIGYGGYFLTMVLWANLHGAFVVGLAWLGVIGVWEFFTTGLWKKRALLFFLCVLATLINPFGLSLLEVPSRALFVSPIAFEEWGAVPWIEPYNTFMGYKLLALWSLVIIFSHLRRKGWKKGDQLAVILTGLFLLASLHQERHTSLFAIVAGGLLPPLFAPEMSLHDIRARKSWLLRLVVRGILVVLPLILAMKLLRTGQGLKLTYPPESCPVAAIDYLRDHQVTGRLLVGFNAGSYAMWKLRGQMRVAMDGRYLLVYRSETFEKIERFYAGTGDWRETLRNPSPDAVLVDRSDGVYPKMLVEPGWSQVYEDTKHAVFRPTPVARR